MRHAHSPVLLTALLVALAAPALAQSRADDDVTNLPGPGPETPQPEYTATRASGWGAVADAVRWGEIGPAPARLRLSGDRRYDRRDDEDRVIRVIVHEKRYWPKRWRGHWGWGVGGHWDLGPHHRFPHSTRPPFGFHGRFGAPPPW